MPVMGLYRYMILSGDENVGNTYECFHLLQISEAEIASSSQRKKIEELEDQLYEAEEIVTDLRAQLKIVEYELDRMKKSEVQYLNEEVQNGCADKINTSKSTLWPVLDTGPILISSSDSEDTHSNQRYVDDNYCVSTNTIHTEPLDEYAVNSDFDSLLMRCKEPDLYRNGCTQRIRAIERNSLSMEMRLPEQSDDQWSNIKSDITIRDTSLKDVNMGFAEKKPTEVEELLQKDFICDKVEASSLSQKMPLPEQNKYQDSHMKCELTIKEASPMDVNMGLAEKTPTEVEELMQGNVRCEKVEPNLLMRNMPLLEQTAGQHSNIKFNLTIREDMRPTEVEELMQKDVSCETDEPNSLSRGMSLPMQTDDQHSDIKSEVTIRESSPKDVDLDVAEKKSTEVEELVQKDVSCEKVEPNSLSRGMPLPEQTNDQHSDIKSELTIREASPRDIDMCLEVEKPSEVEELLQKDNYRKSEPAKFIRRFSSRIKKSLYTNAKVVLRNDQMTEVCELSTLSHCNTYPGLNNSCEDFSRIIEEEVNKNSDSHSNDAILEVTRAARAKNSGNEDKLIKQDSKVAESSVVPVCKINLDIIDVSLINSGLKDEETCEVANGAPTEVANDSPLKYTFRRKRKKDSLSCSDENGSPEKETPPKRKLIENQSVSSESHKPTLIVESSRDTRRLTQVARQETNASTWLSSFYMVS
ncbi:hypothetical protein GIB67_035720 [Kingdonia uniflora]|uniref:Uncharacterized protein n=1 Tax=Kingdonia uniflora TaxID=39325 RepID=A0A7J7M5M4_9MAGN|nr:hypothetical protein GIB67_035720 [Kingdonia uniflora]